MAEEARAADEADAGAVASEVQRLAAIEEAARQASAKAIDEARNLMQRGEVQAARQRLVAAMNGSNAEVVLGFARTFDPNEIAKLAKSDAPADPVRAKALYEHARQLGAKGAEAALKRMEASAQRPSAPTAPPVQGLQRAR